MRQIYFYTQNKYKLLLCDIFTYMYRYQRQLQMENQVDRFLYIEQIDINCYNVIYLYVQISKTTIHRKLGRQICIASLKMENDADIFVHIEQIDIEGYYVIYIY